jgi:glycerol-3-phosphate dehydrogenase (NAD(P)+)
MQKLGVIGAGAWGTALAVVGRRAGRDVRLWALEPEVAAEINQHHRNTPFLPGIALDPGIIATGDLAAAADADSCRGRRDRRRAPRHTGATYARHL